MSVFQRVKKLVVEQLGVDEAEVVITASFTDDLGADSLDLVELIMQMEEEFSSDDNKVEIPDEEAEKLTTIKDAVDFLIAHGVADS